MGARGPKPEAEGKVIGLVPKERARAPEWMKEGTLARATWDRIVNSLPADHFKEADLPLLEKYCLCEQIYHHAARHLSLSLTTITAKGYELPDTHLTIMNQQVKLQTGLATKLRLCPNSRITNNQAGHEKSRPPRNAERQGLMFGGRD